MDEPRYYLWFGAWIPVADWDKNSVSPPPARRQLMFGPRFTKDRPNCAVCGGEGEHVVGCPSMDVPR